MDDRLIKPPSTPPGRIFGAIGKLLTGLGAIGLLITLAPQIRALGRAGRGVDWTLPGLCFAALAIGLVLLILSWAANGYGQRSR